MLSKGNLIVWTCSGLIQLELCVAVGPLSLPNVLISFDVCMT